MATTALLTRPTHVTGHPGLVRVQATARTPARGERDLLAERLRRVHRAIGDFQRAAAELDDQARAEELSGNVTTALVDRTHAKQMRLCVARLSAALQEE